MSRPEGGPAHLKPQDARVVDEHTPFQSPKIQVALRREAQLPGEGSQRASLGHHQTKEVVPGSSQACASGPGKAQPAALPLTGPGTQQHERFLRGRPQAE